MNAAARTSFLTAGTAMREALRPATVVLKLAAQATNGLAASAVEQPVKLVMNEKTGQYERAQSATVQIRKALLPNWATKDSLPGKAKLVIGSVTWKISTAFDTGLTLQLTCMRWPDV